MDISTTRRRRCWCADVALAVVPLSFLGLTGDAVGQAYELSGGPGDQSVLSHRRYVSRSSSGWVVYRASRQPGGETELHSVPADGQGDPVHLNTPIVSGGTVWFPYTSHDGQWVAYAADQDTYKLVEAYVVPIDGSSGPLKLSGSIVAGGDVTLNPRFTPDDKWLVFAGDLEVDEKREVFSVPIDGSKAPIKLSHALKKGEGVYNAIVTDAGRVVYFISGRAYSTAHDGTESPVLLTGNLEPELVHGVSPDKAYLVFNTIEPNGDHVSYSVATDGSTPPVRFNLPASKYHTWRFSPDSLHVAITIENNWEGRIFTAPIDASLDPVKVSGGLDAGLVFEWKTDSAGTQVFFSGARSGYTYNVFVAPLDGSSRPKKITDQPSGSPSAWGRCLSSDGSRLIYTVENSRDNNDLFSIPVDQSSGKIQLNDPPAGEHGVDSDDVRISTLDRVLYREFQAGRVDQYRLYSVPVDGSESPVEVSGPLGQGGSVQWLLLMPDGRRVVYSADQHEDERLELYATHVVPGMGIGLDLEPESVGISDVVRFVAAGGVPGETVALFVTKVNGIPFNLMVATGKFHAGGEWTLLASLPGDPSLSGLEFHLASFSRNVQRQIVRTNSQRLQIH